MAFGAKVKLVVDNSCGKEFRRQIQSLVDTETAAKPIVVSNIKLSPTKTQIKQMVSAFQNEIDTIGVSIPVKKIDATEAIGAFRKQLQTMLDSLSIAGLKEFGGSGSFKNVSQELASLQKLNNEVFAKSTDVSSLEARTRIIDEQKDIELSILDALTRNESEQGVLSSAINTRISSLKEELRIELSLQKSKESLDAYYSKNVGGLSGENLQKFNKSYSDALTTINAAHSADTKFKNDAIASTLLVTSSMEQLVKAQKEEIAQAERAEKAAEKAREKAEASASASPYDGISEDMIGYAKDLEALITKLNSLQNKTVNIYDSATHDVVVSNLQAIVGEARNTFASLQDGGNATGERIEAQINKIRQSAIEAEKDVNRNVGFSKIGENAEQLEQLEKRITSILGKTQNITAISQLQTLQTECGTLRGTLNDIYARIRDGENISGDAIRQSLLDIRQRTIEANAYAEVIARTEKIQETVDGGNVDARKASPIQSLLANSASGINGITDDKTRGYLVGELNTITQELTKVVSISMSGGKVIENAWKDDKVAAQAATVSVSEYYDIIRKNAAALSGKIEKQTEAFDLISNKGQVISELNEIVRKYRELSGIELKPGQTDKYFDSLNDINNLIEVARVKSVEDRVKTITSAQEKIQALKEECSQTEALLAIEKRRSDLAASIQSYTEKNTKASGMNVFKDLEKSLAVLQSGEPMTAESINRIKNKFSEAKEEIRKAGNEGLSFGDRIKSIATKFGAWTSVSQIVMRLWRELKKMVTQVIELDTAMTDLKKVTDETDAVYENFYKTAAKIAKEINSTSKDVISATSTFAKTGLSISDAAEAAKAALVYKNVGDNISSVDDAANSLISTMTAFGLKSSDLMSIVDKFNEVGNNFAITSDGIGEALTRSAAALSNAGNTLDESIALITGANTVIQNPESVGTTLKTATMYLRAAKVEAEDAGESVDGMANSVSSLRNSIKQLTDNRVDIMIDDNTFKSTIQIYRELASVWDDLSGKDTAQSAILNLIGGKRNANPNAAILENFEIVERALAASEGSAGSALAENAKQAESIAGYITRFKEQFQELSQAVVGSDLLKTIINIGTGFMKIVTAIASANGAISALNIALSVVAITIAGIGIVKLVRSLTNIEKVIKTIQTGFKNFGTIIKNMIQSGSTAADAAAALGTTVKASFSAVAETITAIISALMLVITLFYTWEKQRKQEEEARREQVKQEAEDDKEKLDTLTDLIAQYKNLAQAADGVYDESRLETISDLQKQINENLGGQAGNLDLINGKYQESIDLLLEQQKAAAMSSYGSMQLEMNEQKEDLNEFIGYNGKDNKNEYNFSNWAQKNNKFVHNGFGSKQIDFSESVLNEYFEFLKQRDKDFELIKKNIEYFKSSDLTSSITQVRSPKGETSVYGSLLNGINISTEDQVVDLYNAVVEAQTYLSSYYSGDDSYTKTSSAYTYLQGIRTKLEEQVKEYTDAKKAYDEVKATVEITSMLQGRRVKSNQDYAAIVSEIESNSDYNETMQSFMKNYLETLFGEYAKTPDAELTVIQKVADSYKKRVDLFNSAKKEMDSLGYVTADTYNSLLTADSDYSSMFQASAEGIVIVQSNMDSLLETLAQNTAATLADNNATNDQISALYRYADTIKYVSATGAEQYSQIDELSDYREKSISGITLTAQELEELTNKYPELQSAVIATADGYIVETNAISKLIIARQKNLKLIEAERKLSVIEAINDMDGVGTFYERVNAYNQAANGSSITSFSEFVKSAASLFGSSESTSTLDFMREYVELMAQYNTMVAEETSLETTNSNGAVSALTRLEREIEFAERNGESTEQIVSRWKSVISEAKKEINQYAASGRDMTSDEIYNLYKTVWDAEDNISDLLDEDSVEQTCEEILSDVLSMYDTLTSAAKEFSENGFITVDTFKSILALGNDYLKYLIDENGAITFDEEAVRRLTAARVDDLAVAQAQALLDTIKAHKNDAAALKELAYATEEASGSAWDLVYAQLAQMNLGDDLYNAFLKQINALRSMAESAKSSIGKTLGTSADGYISQADALDKILSLTEDLIKKEAEDQADALQKQIDAYKDIIDLKKQSLENAKEEEEHAKKLAEYNKGISKTKSQIDALMFDDSLSARAQILTLQEDLSSQQSDLADYQAEYEYNAKTDALDKEADAYEKNLSQQIDAVNASVDTTQKLYELAIAQIDAEWETLKDRLVSYNAENGDSVESEIVSAWDAATEAVRRYGSFAAAVSGASGEGVTQISDSANTFVGADGTVYEYVSPKEIASQIPGVSSDDAEKIAASAGKIASSAETSTQKVNQAVVAPVENNNSVVNVAYNLNVDGEVGQSTLTDLKKIAQETIRQIKDMTSRRGSSGTVTAALL